MKPNQLLWAIYTFGLLTLFQSCSQEPARSSSNTIRIQVANDVDILNPVLSRLSVSTFAENQLYLPLAKWDESSDQWKPVLVRSYHPQLSGDSVQYTLVFRPEAHWSDREKIDVEDLLYTVKMGLNPYLDHQSWAAYLDLLTGVSGNGDTLRLSLETPYILADEFIAGLTPYPAHILDPEQLLDSIPFSVLKSGRFSEREDQILKSLASAFNQFGMPDHWPLPVSGMYHVRGWLPGQILNLARLDTFWAEDVEELTPIFDTNIDTIQLAVIPDPQNALHAFTSGNVDVVTTIDDRDSTLLESFDGSIHSIPTLQMYYIAPNHRNELLGQVSVRQALNISINRQDMIERLFQGKGEAAYGPIHPEKYYFQPMPVKFDPEGARQILNTLECRDADGNGILECPSDGKYLEMSFRIWTTRTQLSRNVATLLKGYWRTIGVNIEIQSADFRTFLPELQNKTFDLATLALRQNNLLDDPYPLWHSTQATATGKNYQALENDSIDQVLEDLRKSVRPADQNKNYQLLQELFASQVPVFFLVAPGESIGFREGIELFWTPSRPGFDLSRSKLSW